MEVWVMYLLAHVFSSQSIHFLLFPSGSTHAQNPFRCPFPGYVCISSLYTAQGEKLFFSMSHDCS